MRETFETRGSGERCVPGMIRARRGDAGQVGQRDAGRRQRVADAAFEGAVACVELRPEPGGCAEIRTRSHDAEDAGEPGHAHGVGRMGRLSRVADDVEDLSLGEVVNRKPVEPCPARAGVALAELPGRLPRPGGAFLGAHAHGADDPPAEAGIGLQVAAKLALDRSTLMVRSAKPD